MPTVTTPPHAHRLRLGRYSETDRVYLLTTVTHQRSPIFTNLSLGRIVVQAMRYQHEQQNVYSLAFVIMPDHLHWLLQLQGRTELSILMKQVKGYSASQINKAQRTTGRIWQAGYYDHAVRKEEDIQVMARYIAANPLRAGLVDRIEDYALWDAIWL